MIGDHPDRELLFRYYDPATDREQVLAIFAKQKLKVALPLPGEDPATTFGLVGEKDGEIKYALFPRATFELHLVADPDEKLQPYMIRRLGALTEGALMQLGTEMKKLKLPVATDTIAFVPRSMPDMVDYCKDHLGFIDEAIDDFHMLVKRLGS